MLSITLKSSVRFAYAPVSQPSPIATGGVSLQPSDPIILHDLGLACLEVGRLADAITALQRAVANAMALDLLGNLLAECGRFDEAHDCLQRAIEMAPLLAGSYYDLVPCRPVTHDVGRLPRMTAALDTPGLELAQRLRLHLAIGKAADDLGEYALSTGFSRPYPGEKVVRHPRGFANNAAPNTVDLD